MRPGELRRQKSKNILRLAFLTTRAALATGAVILLFSLGINRGLPADRDIAPQHSGASIRRWAADILQSVGYRPYADLTEASLSTPPANGDWSDQGVADVDGAHLNLIDLRFARAYRAFLANAKLWRANLEGAYLSEADLRGANMREAVSARRHSRSRPHFAHASRFFRHQQRKSDRCRPSCGRSLLLQSRKLAPLQRQAQRRIALRRQSAQSAQLTRYDLTGADLRDTKLEQSMLSFANLQQTDLSSAKMSQAKLGGAQTERHNLARRRSQLRRPPRRVPHRRCPSRRRPSQRSPLRCRPPRRQRPHLHPTLHRQMARRPTRPRHGIRPPIPVPPVIPS